MSKLNKVMKSLKEMYSHKIPEFRAELIAAQEKKERKKEKKRAELEKAHKYIRRWYSNDEWHYEYPSNQKRSVTRTEAKNEIAKKTPLITGIKPLSHASAKEIDEALVKLSLYAMDGKLKCTALGNSSVYITGRTQDHIIRTNGIDREEKAMQHKAKYIPFIPAILKNGRISEKSSSKKGVIYGVIGRVKYFDDTKNKEVVESVELAINYDKDLRKYVFSFANAAIKKSLLTGKDSFMVTFEAYPVGACKAEAVSTTAASIPQTIKKSNGTKTAKHPPHTPFTVHITELTEGNRAAKFTELTKALRGEETRFIPSDGTKPLQNVDLHIKDLSPERVEKAVRTMALTLGVPLKSAKGEVFLYKAQEELTDTWCAFFSTVVQNAYDFVTAYFDLPKKTVMSKSQKLTYRGKVLYKPETGEPIAQREWDRFVKTLEDFLNRNVKDADKKIVLQASSLAKILDRMLKYNTLEAITHMKLEDVTYHEKSFDWISDSVKNMSRSFGESFTRQEQARIEVIRQSAAQKITNVTDKVRADIQQILIDGVKGKKSKSAVSQELFNRMIGDNRDYQRLADTEIQNAFNNAFLREEAYNAKEGEKVYFQRIEVVDDNTCPFCRRMNGKIALWSDKPLANDTADDTDADYVIWEGKEWSGKEKSMTTGVFHPYCRGSWVRYEKEFSHLDALIAEKSGQAKRWNEAVKQAEKEFKDKGIANPDDRTQGFRERINEIFTASGDIAKSLTYSGHKLQGRRTFAGLKISIENRKGSIRRGIDSNGHKWAIKMNYDYGYIRGTVGVDGDHVDCYLGDNEDAENVYIIRQNNPETHTYDEDKCMLGFNSLAEAKRAFLSQYDRPGFLGKIVTARLDLFKKKIYLKKYRGKKLL